MLAVAMRHFDVPQCEPESLTGFFHKVVRRLQKQRSVGPGRFAGESFSRSQVDQLEVSISLCLMSREGCRQLGSSGYHRMSIEVHRLQLETKLTTEIG